MSEIIKLSPLNKTWILDLDGTIVKHNGYKIDGVDSFLPGAEEFLKNVSMGDMVIFITSRTKEQKETTEKFLKAAGIRFDTIIYNAPYGERILINDKKPSGLEVSIALNTERDLFCSFEFEIDGTL